MKLEKLLDELEIPGYALDRDVREAIQEIAKKYSQDAQYLKDTVRGLVDIAINTKDKDAVIESAKTILKYEGKTAEIIAYGLKDIAENNISIWFVFRLLFFMLYSLEIYSEATFL